MIQSRDLLASAVSLLLAALLWIPAVHLFFRPAGMSDEAKALAAQQLQFWSDPSAKTSELQRMRNSNAEWDFMGRTFLALALCELCERDPARKTHYLTIVDGIIQETLTLEKERGIHFFLMPYSKARPYVDQPARSLFLDGELALMLAARRVVEEKLGYKTLLTERLRSVEERFKAHPDLALESYPNECWMFDHAFALAAFRMQDFLDATDHSTLFRAWGKTAREKLTDPKSGLLVSDYSLKNEWMDGPEGSSIWAAIHFIRLFDPDLAAAQYAKARQHLARTLLGFGWSREWPVTWRNWIDIDSGAVVPILDAGAAASGLALIASASSDDNKYFNALRASLNFAAFPVKKDGKLRYAGSNAVGDAALLYAYTLGPLWKKISDAEKTSAKPKHTSQAL